LLAAVASLRFGGRLSVVVVDNDGDGDGEAVCSGLAAGYRWPLTWRAEAQGGISFARNRAVALALAQRPDFIAMLDDDEWPEPDWLGELLRVQAATAADAVGGPVLPRFPAGGEHWQQFADYFAVDQGRPDGASCVLYAAGNFLARAECFQMLMPTPFDPAFAHTGGEDLLFFRRLAANGRSMHWARTAVVHEAVSPERLDLGWLKRRQMRRGNLNVRIQRIFEPGPLRECVRLAKTAGLLVMGAAFYVAVFPHRSRRVRAQLLVRKALGKAMGHLGRPLLEYPARPANAPPHRPPVGRAWRQ
jgi:glycosyltransferase involved in cell wall biosynthesis